MARYNLSNKKSSLIFFTFLTLMLVWSCKKPDFPTLSSNDILSLALKPDSVQADNYSYAEISAKANAMVVDTTNTLTFITDLGTFANGTNSFSTNFDIDGMAFAYLRSGTVQTAHVKVTVGANYSQLINIPFVTSWPDTLFINIPASISNALGNRVDVTAQLIKYNGSLTPNLIVGFSATDTAGNSIGTFTNVKPSDASGSAPAQFWLQDTAYTGFVNIKCKMITNSNRVLQSFNKILITK